VARQGVLRTLITLFMSMDWIPKAYGPSSKPVEDGPYHALANKLSDVFDLVFAEYPEDFTGGILGCYTSNGLPAVFHGYEFRLLDFDRFSELH